MRLRRDHGPRAGMVNSVSSSIRQADPLATRPPPSHALVTPEASLYIAVIYPSPSFHPLPTSLSLSLLVLAYALPPFAKLHRYCGTTKWSHVYLPKYASTYVGQFILPRRGGRTANFTSARVGDTSFSFATFKRLLKNCTLLFKIQTKEKRPCIMRAAVGVCKTCPSSKRKRRVNPNIPLPSLREVTSLRKSVGCKKEKKAISEQANCSTLRESARADLASLSLCPSRHVPIRIIHRSSAGPLEGERSTRGTGIWGRTR